MISIDIRTLQDGKKDVGVVPTRLSRTKRYVLDTHSAVADLADIPMPFQFSGKARYRNAKIAHVFTMQTDIQCQIHTNPNHKPCYMRATEELDVHVSESDRLERR